MKRDVIEVEVEVFVAAEAVAVVEKKCFVLSFVLSSVIYVVEPIQDLQ